MLDKITFVNGTIVTKEYLNEVQNGTDFSGAPARDNFYAATDAEKASWGIAQRDKLKDYEIANPREEGETAIGRLAHDGIILGHGVTDFTGWSIADATFTAPETVPVNIGDDQTITVDLSGTPESYAVVVEAGKIVLSTGAILKWFRQFVGLVNTSGDNYLYVLEESADPAEPKIAISNAFPSASSVPHIPLAKVSVSNGQINVDGVVDYRPSLYIGALNNYSTGVLKNTPILSASETINSWDRAILDTRNGSVIVTLPASPTDSDRVAIVDLEGSFDRYPVVLRPSDGTKINNSVDDWIINIRDSNIELFYNESTAEWRFEETPGSECNPRLGTFISCGGREFLGVREAGECPDGQAVPGEYPNPSEGVYRFEAATTKCYKEVNTTVAIYSDGEGGLIKVFGADKCKKVGAGGTSAGSEIAKNIIYVDPAVGDDRVINSGTDSNRPFRTLERAILEAARGSRRTEGLDAYDTTVIELAPGDHYIDNFPGLNAVGAISSGDSYIKQVTTGATCLKDWTKESPYISITTNNNAATQPPVAFSLGRSLYTASGAVGTIYKIEKESINSVEWKIYLQYVNGSFSLGDEIFINRLSDVNPSSGGLIVPRGISINGVDLRKVRVRPMYVPALTPGQNTAQDKRTYIFKVTGGTYISLLTFTDNQQIPRTHNTVTCVGYASEEEIKGSPAETSFYTKIFSLFSGIDGWGSQDGISEVGAETTIVAPLAASKEDRSQDTEQNVTGVKTPDINATVPEYPGGIALSTIDGGAASTYKLPDVNSTRSSSPYVFNCSVRSIFGLNGMWVDGSRVSGFKSMVAANYTQVSLQTDPNCFETPTVEYYNDPPTNKQTGSGKRYRGSTADPFKYRHWGFRSSSDAQVQLVSCFVIGNADHFISESGSDLSITNSCSDFGDISLRALGYKPEAFSQDKGVPSGTYGGTRITQIIPPLPLSYSPLADGSKATLTDTSINTGLVLDYQKTLDYVVAAKTSSNNAPSVIRIYVKNSNNASPFTLKNAPKANDVAFGQFSYTKKTENGEYILAGGKKRTNRQRIYISGFDETGTSIQYTGNIQVVEEGNSGYQELDDRSKIFIWDTSKSAWYISVKTSGITEETYNKNAENKGDLDGDGFLLKRFNHAFRFKLNPDSGSNATYANVDFIFDKAPVKLIRGVDGRTDRQRVYKVLLEGFNRDFGLRKPQSYYILEKQVGPFLNGGTELTSDPLTVTQVISYKDFYNVEESESTKGKYISYLTQSSVARDVFTGDFVPTRDADEPEATEDPANSITRTALVKMNNRPGVTYAIDSIGPGVNPINILVDSNSTVPGFLVGLHRPSVIRSSGHTWEWTGYLNYDTAFPKFQGDPLEQDFALGKTIVEETGGRVYATGMNEEGNYYLGTTVFDLRSGEQFSIPLKAENEVGNISNQVLANVIVKNTLLMQDESSLVFGNGTSILFGADTELKGTTAGVLNAENAGSLSVYATESTAGFVQLASEDTIRGAFNEGSIGIADKVAVTAANLATELQFRESSALQAGTGVSIITSAEGIERPGGDPNDDSDNFFPQIVSIGQDVSTSADVNFASVKATGDVIAYYVAGSSDARLKNNVISLDGSLSKVESLRGVSFEYKQYPGVPRIGFIAQEVKEVIPEVVKADKDTDMLSVAYQDLVPVLVEAIKELSDRVKKLEQG